MSNRKKRSLTAREKASLDALVGKSEPGIVTAHDIVKAARAKRHPLHGRFEWNTQKAAYEHWVEQARDIVQIYVTVVNGDSEPVHALVSVVSVKGEPGYMPIRSVMASEDALASLRESFARDLLSVLKRYAYLRSSMLVKFKAIERIAGK